VHARAAAPWEERIVLDVWYVEHRSPLLDLKILARTPLALFSGTYKGATGGWRARQPRCRLRLHDELARLGGPLSGRRHHVEPVPTM
jgi:hypothetical protein